MIPFRKNQDEASMAGPVEKIKRSPDEGADYDYLEACAEDLISAVKSGNAKLVADAIRTAFQVLDSEPHEEGPHI